MSEPSWWLLALAALVVVAGVAVIARLVVTEADVVTAKFGRAPLPARVRGRRPSRAHVSGADERARQAAIVVNPSKFEDVRSVRARVEATCASLGWQPPLWLETSIEDPGTGQAREAIDAGVEVVCALGGDGTVRTVASELVGTGIPFGLLPAGTGNLLARNLSLPVDSLEAALRVALGGRNSRIDTCALTLTRPTEEEATAEAGDDGGEPEDAEVPAGRGASEEHVFLAMAGLGFDAEVMAGVQDDMKSNLGWAAYIVVGLRHLRGPQFRAEVVTDEGLRLRRRVRSVLVGNIGKLQGGVLLLPDAEVDDGVLDLVLLSPKGVVGWGSVVARLVTRQRRGHHRVDHHTARRVQVRTRRPVAIQLDGDSLGEAMGMVIEVKPASLVVRRPT